MFFFHEISMITRLAESKKENGNQLFQNKKYEQAIQFYTEAIGLCPESPLYYGNRSACYMMLHQYKKALEDSRKSVSLDNSFVKGYIRIAKCSLELGDISAANNAISSVKRLSPGNPAILPEIKKLEVIKVFENEGNEAYQRQNFRKVVFWMDRILDQIQCAQFQLKKAECLAFLGMYQKAQEIANDILDVDKQNAEAIYVRGMCLYYQDNEERAFSHLQHVLRLAPNHKKAMDIYKRAKALKQKKEKGNYYFKAGRLNEAYNLYTEALNMDPRNKSTNAKLYFNRAAACSELGRKKEAVADCSSALELDRNYLKALLRRAKCYMDLTDFEKAVTDYKRAIKMDDNREYRRLLQEAELALEKSKHKDYYTILGVNKKASAHEIKRAYKKKAFDHHPDRHPNASERVKIKQEKIFKEVGEAYGILSDPSSRAFYDTFGKKPGVQKC